jgi:hypothetical protein
MITYMKNPKVRRAPRKYHLRTSKTAIQVAEMSSKIIVHPSHDGIFPLRSRSSELLEA